MREAYVLCLVAVIGLAAATPATADSILVVDFGAQSLVDINATTGAVNFTVAGFTNPLGVTVDGKGNIYVSTRGANPGDATIDKVDPISHTFSVFASNSIGSGASLDRPFQMATDAAGNIYVADGQASIAASNIIKIDATGMTRTLVSGAGVGSGPAFGSLSGLTLDNAGNLIASAPFAHELFSVDPTTGARTLLSSLGTSFFPEDLATTSLGQIVTINGYINTPSIYSVDPTTGTPTVLADNNGTGSGPLFGTLRSVTIGAGGALYATDILNAQIFQVNPANGNRTIIAGNGVGGTTFTQLVNGIAYDSFSYAVPEPSSLALVGVGVVMGLGAWLRRRLVP